MKILVLGDFQGVFPAILKQRLKKEEFDLVIAVGDYAGIDEWRPYIMHALSNSRKGKEIMSHEEFFGKKVFQKLLKKDFEAGKKVLMELNNLDKPVILIFGNSDDGWYNYPFIKELNVEKKKLNFVKKLKNIKNINYGKTRIYGADFVGFGGYMDIEAFFDKKQFNEDKFKIKKRIKRHGKVRERLFNIISKIKKNKNPRIFIFHYPPYGVFDIIRDRKDNPMNGKSAGVKFFTEVIKKYKPKLVLCGHMHEYQGAKKFHGSLVVNPGDGQKGKYAIVDYPSLKVRVVK